MEDHVRPVLTRRIPTVRVMLSVLFQGRISNFKIYMWRVVVKESEYARAMILGRKLFSPVLQLPSCAYDRICIFFETIHLSSRKARDLLCSRFDFFVKEQGFGHKCPPKY